LNPDVTPFQRSFVGEIRRVDEMARRVRFFSTQIDKEKDVIPIRPLYDSAPLITVGPRAAQTIDDLDVTLAEHESRLQQMNDSYKTLSERTKELVEARHVLRETAVFFDQVTTSTHLSIIRFNFLHRLKISTAIFGRLLMTVRLLCCSMTIARIDSLPPASNLILSLWRAPLTVRVYPRSSESSGVFCVAIST
jgi:vacuolar-type H+-ATPase subunit I/STV1